MGPHFEPRMAEAVGRKILSLKGASLIELLYFLEEENSLELLRGFSALGLRDQRKVLAFLNAACDEIMAKVELGVGRDDGGVQPGG